MIISGSIDFRTYKTFSALSSFADYWSENEGLIKKAADEEEERSGPKWKPQDEDQIGEYCNERRMAREFHDEIMTSMLRYSCIVMLCTTIERELRRFVENLEKERGLQLLKVKDIRGSSFLTQVAKYIEVFFGPQLSKCTQYAALCDLQKIRNCIVHCRGEVALSGDKAYLLKLAKRRTGFIAVEGIDLDIEAKCIEQFINECWQFFTWLFGEVKWKMDDSWAKYKWAKPLVGAKILKSNKK